MENARENFVFYKIVVDTNNSNCYYHYLMIIMTIVWQSMLLKVMVVINVHEMFFEDFEEISVLKIDIDLSLLDELELELVDKFR